MLRCGFSAIRDTGHNHLCRKNHDLVVFKPPSCTHYSWMVAAGARSSVDIAARIVVIRGQRVMLDHDLAALYGVTTARLNQQVRRNRVRFPADFLLELTAGENTALMLQIATSKERRGGRRKPPLAFTEHGAIMAASVLNSARAVEMSVYVVRAFVRLKALVISNRHLARKLAAVERSLLALDLKTREELKEVYAAIQALTAMPVTKRRAIGFTADL